LSLFHSKYEPSEDVKRAVAIAAVRVAKYVAAHGYQVKSVDFSKPGRSAYITITNARKRRVRVRISDHPRRCDPLKMLSIKCFKSWRNQRSALTHFLASAGPPIVTAAPSSCPSHKASE